MSSPGLREPAGLDRRHGGPGPHRRL